MAKAVGSTDAWLTLAEAAPLCALSVSGLRKMIAKGQIKYKQTKPHAPIYLCRDWIDEYNRSTTRQIKLTVDVETDTSIDWSKL